MSSNGKVQVLVRSRRVPIGTTVVTTPIYSASGMLLGSDSKRVVIYGTRLDESHRNAIEEGFTLSRKLGLELEVVDAAKSGLLRRVISLVRRGASRQPAFRVAPQAEEDTTSGLFPVK